MGTLKEDFNYKLKKMAYFEYRRKKERQALSVDFQKLPSQVVQNSPPKCVFKFKPNNPL